MTHHEVEKYSKATRILHWVHSGAFVLLFLTGLVLFIPALGGLAQDSWTRIIHRIASVIFDVEDEYDTVEPAILGFGEIIELEAWRNGTDKDGRLYTLSVSATDVADNEASAETTVICHHDQRDRNDRH